MSKINKQELFDGIHQVINESLNPSETPKYKQSFGIKKSISNLLESASKDSKLMDYLIKFDNSVTDYNEGSLLESYVEGLKKFNTKETKDAVKSLLEGFGVNEPEYVIIRLYESISSDACKDYINEALNAYLVEKSEATKEALNSVLINAYVYNEPATMQLYSYINEEHEVGMYVPAVLKIGALYEAKETAEEKKIELTESKLQKVYENVDKYVNEKIAEALNEQEEKYSLEAVANNNGINLMESCTFISKKCNNADVKAIVEQYSNALMQGAYEERLYETFMTNLAPYSHFSPVETALSALKQRIDNAKVDIDLTKILECMSQSTSYYIVPLIEEDVVRYMKKKNPVNRAQLLNACGAFAADPYVKEILEAVYLDQDIRMNTIEESVVGLKDQVKFLHENATLSNIYSPVQYIKENESVFNVNNTFYLRAGNTISKLDEASIKNLPQNFVALCQLVNDSNVQINENDIALKGNDIFARIYEGYAEINGNKESAESLRNLSEMYMKYNNYDTNFFVMATCLLENFNKIASIDFVKHIESVKNPDVNLDLFKLNESLFISAHNDELHQHTFYRNVNPIQCSNIINEHMGMNISNMFEDLLPNQDKILVMLSEGKDEFEENIEKLEASIQELKDAKADATEEDQKTLDKAIEDSEDKLKDLKDEYKEWQKNADDTIKASGETKSDLKADDDEEDYEGGTIMPHVDEPIDADDVNPEDFTSSLTQDIDNVNMYADADDSVKEEPSEAAMAADDAEIEANAAQDAAEAGDTFAAADDAEAAAADAEQAAQDSEDVIQAGDDSFVDNSDDDIFAEETPAEDEINPDEPTDMFDTETPAEPEEKSDNVAVNDDVYEEDFTYKIANVMFDENVKTGKKASTGKVNVLIPMIDKEGNKYVDSQEISFYLEGGEVVLDNSEMSEELYKAVVSAIEEHPDYSALKDETPAVQTPSEAEKDADVFATETPAEKPAEAPAETPKEEPTGVPAPEPVKADDIDFGEEPEKEEEPDENIEDIFNMPDDDDDDDEEEILSIDGKPADEEDDSETADFDFADDYEAADPVLTYKDDDSDTEFELPAASEDGTEIKESFIKIRPLIKK